MEESGDKKKRNWKSDFWVGIIVVIITGLLISLLYGLYTSHLEKGDLKSQIDPMLRKADSLHDSGEFEEAIEEYESILEIISPKNLPLEYAITQNNLGNAYRDLAGVRDKETNLEKAITAYQEVLKIYTEEKYPIIYQKVSSNLEAAQRELQ